MARVVEGRTVLLCKDGVYKAAKLFIGRKANFNRHFFFPDSAIGQPFGGKFEIKGQHLIPVAKTPPEVEEEEEDEVCTGSNRKIVDDATSQRLTHEEIQSMKKSGCSGQDILESVVQNSATYSERTKFSQEKYRKKKEKKHIPMLTILKPSTRLLCKMYSARGPSKICHIRYDTVGQMLTLGNVRAGSNIIVMETCQGLLLGAVLERMGGFGKLVHVFFGDIPVKTALDSFSQLSPDHLSLLTHYPLHRVANLSCHGNQAISNETSSEAVMECTSELSSAHVTEEGIGEVDEKEEELEEEEEEEEEEGDEEAAETLHAAKRLKLSTDEKREDEEKRRRREERELMYQRSGDLLQARNMDGLLVASRFHPEPIVMSLLEFVAPSRPIVVYSQFQETLVQCYQKLKESGKVFNLELTETWTRQYQVLPGRTHPEVNMNAQSGYLLFGTTTTTNITGGVQTTVES